MTLSIADTREGLVVIKEDFFYLSLMSIHIQTHKPGIYFITFTCYAWLPLIEVSQGYKAVYRFFEVLAGNNHTILAYVIMPNHLHLILHYSGGQSLNTIIGNGKRFMAYEIVRFLSHKGEKKLLEKLQADVAVTDRNRGKKHQVWINSFDCKECRTEKFLLQKLIYLHENPVSGKWKLSDHYLNYLHSSAPFYFNGRQQLFAVKDYHDFLDWENMYG
jgi:REP element-mobilizing transposase RayT